MPASPLTDDTWTGLPLLQCDMDPGSYRLDVDTPVLIFRTEPGLFVEMPDEDGGCLEFRQAPLRFDLFASGVEMIARSDRPGTKSLVVALPLSWLAVHAEDAAGNLALRSRIQFADNALRRLVWRLTTHHRHGEPLGTTYSGAVSRILVDRIVTLQAADEARSLDADCLEHEARRLVEALFDADLRDPPSVSALASKVGMGTTRFARAFRTTFETSPHRYVQRRRLQRARELLRGTDASITSIALDTGFASHAHFSTVFRAETGMTPSHYRRTGPLATRH